MGARQNLPSIVSAAGLLTLAVAASPADADVVITSDHSILTALHDVTNLGSPNPTFNGRLSKPATDPDLYVNAITLQPGANWDPNLVVELPTQWYHDNESAPYQFGTPITGAAEWQYLNLASVSGAVDPIVPVGIYDFTINITGGADATASDLLASIPLQYEVFDSIAATATFSVSPNPLPPGGRVDVSVTLTNNTPGRDFVVTSWYAFTGTAFNNGAGASLDFEHFSGSWFGTVLAEGQSRTDLHSTWSAKPGLPGGIYTGDVGIYGGLHEGDFFAIDVRPSLTLTGGPAIPGDANYSALIDPDDYALIDRGLALGLSGWENGDFNNDGVIDQLDYLLIDQSYAAQSGGSLSPDLLAARAATFGDAYVTSLLASLPEPVALPTLTLCLSRAGARRRRD